MEEGKPITHLQMSYHPARAEDEDCLSNWNHRQRILTPRTHDVVLLHRLDQGCNSVSSLDCLLYGALMI